VQHDDRVPNPTLGTFGLSIIEEALQRAWVWLPAEVTAYFPPTGRLPAGMPQTPAQVSLQVSLLQARAVEHDDDLNPGETLELGTSLDPQEGTPRADRFGGRLAIAPYAPIPRAVVWRPGLGMGCRLRGPIPIGTRGIALVSSRMVDMWQSRDGAVDPVWPATAGFLHNPASCAFLPTMPPGPIEELDDEVAEAVLGTSTDDARAQVRWLGNGRMSIAVLLDLLLGGDTAPGGVARLHDSIAPTGSGFPGLDMKTWINVVSAALNTVAPGTVSPALLAAVLQQIGTVSSASTKVKSE
jgi:hypothetical protein